MKKGAPTYKPGDDDLTLLFDTGDVDHFHYLIVNLADPASEAQRESMSQSLRDLVGKPIEKLRERIFESGRGTSAVELEPLDRFALGVRLAALRLSRCTALSEELAQEYADDLKRVWINFIAYGAAHRMYWDLPREWQVNKDKTAAMRDQRDALAYGARVDHDLIIKRYAELVAAKKRGIRKTVATEFGLSENTIRNIWNGREK